MPLLDLDFLQRPEMAFGGGLLDLLRNSAMGQNMNAGIGADVAQYPGAPQQQQQRFPTLPVLDQGQFNEIDAAARGGGNAPARPQRNDQPSPLDTAQWPYGPNGAPSDNAALPPNAAPTSGKMPAVAPFSLAPAPAAAPQPPAVAADASPGVGDRLMNGFKGLIGNLHNGPLGALAGGLGAVVTGERTDPGGIEARKLAQSNNATVRALTAKGVDPATIAAAQANPEILKQLVLQHYGPSQVQVLGNGYIRDPRTGQTTRAYEPDDKAPTPLGEGYIWQDGKIVRAYTPRDKAGTQADVSQREAAAAKLGLKPEDPRYQSFVLTGKMPREDAQPLTATDKKAILEADEHISSTQQGIENLRRAKDLSKKAYEGPMAGKRGYVTSLYGDEAGTATTDLNNLITTNALQQLKATFGGNPTEGERAILLDIQGSANQPDPVRQKIYDRAITAMERRLAFNQQQADQLRGGTFYKKEGGMSGKRAAPGGKTAGGLNWSVEP